MNQMGLIIKGTNLSSISSIITSTKANLMNRNFEDALKAAQEQSFGWVEKLCCCPKWTKNNEKPDLHTPHLGEI